jgi:two-component system response regulator GlrR
MMKTSHAKILLVDDDADLLQLLEIRLEAAGYEVHAVDSAEKALSCLAIVQPGVVITDLRMQGMDGMALFDVVHRERPALPVIILTAHGTIPDAVEATRRGVFGYLTKPFNSKELLDYVARAMRVSSAAGTGSSPGEKDWRADIVSGSQDMEALLDRAGLAARSEASILIVGESGTGKELVAQAIHRASPRSGRPFVAVNTSAIPETLLESELFGHVRGAFTGASRAHDGLFQAADGGTLFLDEIGDMPLGLQAKLLRALQEREIERVGSTRTVKVDIRVVCATNRDLAVAVREGRFRQDLFYRLDVLSIRVPPLRVRRQDLGEWLRYGVRQQARLLGWDRLPQVSDGVVKRLQNYDFPNNLRELDDHIYRALQQARQQNKGAFSAAGTGPYRLPDDVFWTPSRSTRVRVDIWRWKPALREWMRSPWLWNGLLFGLVSWVFVLVNLWLWLGPQDRHHNGALSLFWAWW